MKNHKKILIISQDEDLLASLVGKFSDRTFSLEHGDGLREYVRRMNEKEFAWIIIEDFAGSDYQKVLLENLGSLKSNSLVFITPKPSIAKALEEKGVVVLNSQDLEISDKVFNIVSG